MSIASWKCAKIRLSSRDVESGQLLGSEAQPGRNNPYWILGQLLTSLRDELRRQKGYTGETVTRYLTGVKTNTLVINGKTVIGKDSEWPVNFLMVAHGWAYHYKEPSAMRNHCLLEAERIAKDSRKGVWQDGTNGGIRPWEHRRNRGKRLTDI